MPVTLEQAKLNVQDALQLGVIDEFRQSSFLFDNLIFDDAVSPTGGGATLTYAYTRVKTPAAAEFREINTEYTANEATKERHIVDLKIFGGRFEIDRVIANMGGIADEVYFQMQQKIKAAASLFNTTVINGDSATDSKAFDGLDKALTGSSTELIPAEVLDLSTSELITANTAGFLDVLDEFLMGLDGTPSFIAGNTKAIAKLRAAARRSAMYQQTLNSFGRQVETYGGIAMIDLGSRPGTNEPVVAIEEDGTTSLYAARIGLDGFHGVSMAGQPPIQTWLPDFTTAGAVKSGEVEMVAAVALKASKAAGVLRKIKVQ